MNNPDACRVPKALKTLLSLTIPRNGAAQHCLVQASVNNHPMLLDPSYGIYYADRDGGPLGIADLQDGADPKHVPLPGVTNFGYPDNCYYDFAYTSTRTANWTRSRSRRAAYRVLCACFGTRVNRLAVPAFLEWPQHLTLILVGAALLTIHVIGANLFAA